MKKYSVGVLGATGMVGQRFISLLDNHPWFNIRVLAASSKSVGKTYEEAVNGRWAIEAEIPRNIKNIIMLDVKKDMKKISNMVDFVFCAVNMEKSEILELEEAYAKLECPVISNNSANRMISDIPMIIPEINFEHTNIIPYQRKRLHTKRGFIAVKSNCSIQCYVPVLHPLFDYGIDKILVCTYQSLSGAGKTFNSWPQMADNIIPFISGEEEKSEIEPLKIWGKIQNNAIKLNSSIHITTQCIRVPVTQGHMAAVFTSFKNSINICDIIKIWDNYTPYINKFNLPSAPKKLLNYITDNDRPQVKIDREFQNGMGISIGRLRQDTQYDIKFVSVSHNTIRGAAGGAILLAELLCYQMYI